MPLTLNDFIRVATNHTEQELEGIAETIEEEIKKQASPISQQHLIRMELARVSLSHYLIVKAGAVVSDNREKGITEEAREFIYGFYMAGMVLHSPANLVGAHHEIATQINPKLAGHKVLERYEIAKETEQWLHDEPSGFALLSQLKESPAGGDNMIKGIRCFSEQYTALYNRFSPAPSA